MAWFSFASLACSRSVLVIVLTELSVMADVRPSNIASTLSVGVTEVAGSRVLTRFGGVVNVLRWVSWLPNATYDAFSLAARTALITLEYNGSLGVKKLTMTEKRLTMLVSGVKGSESIFLYVKRMPRAWRDQFWRVVAPYLMDSYQRWKFGAPGRSRRDSIDATSIVSPVGMQYPPTSGNTLGMRVIHEASLGSLISRPRRSGPGGITGAPSAAAGASSVTGSDAEMAMLRMVGMLLTAAIVIHCVLMSRIWIVTGQITFIVSPREPAKTASVPFAVGKGHERTAREAGPVGFSIKNAIWLTNPLSQRLARRVSAG